MARYTLYLLVMVAAALLLACLATVAQLLLAVSKEATFSGKTGKKIAFVSTRDTRFPESRDIYTMNPNGEAVHRLTNHPERYFELACSPDGSKTAFMCFFPRSVAA
jgi:hypothetical protein